MKVNFRGTVVSSSTFGRLWFEAKPDERKEGLANSDERSRIEATDKEWVNTGSGF